MLRKKERGFSIILCWLLLIPLIYIPYLPEAEAPLIGDRIWWREKEYTGYVEEPIGQFNKNGCVNMNQPDNECITNTQAALGRGLTYFWLEFNGAWIQGKRVNITSRGSGTQSYQRIGFVDGPFDRTSNIDFNVNCILTTQFDCLKDGNVQLQLIRWGVSWGGAPGSVTDSIIVDVDNRTESTVSLMFRAGSNNLISAGEIQLGNLTIQDASSGAVLWREDLIAGSVTLEVSGGRNDYGYYSPFDNPIPNYCFTDDIYVLDLYIGEFVLSGYTPYLIIAQYGNYNASGLTDYRLAFSDGVNWINVTYNHAWFLANGSQGAYTIISGEGLVQVYDEIGGYILGDNETLLSVTFPLFFLNTILDAEDVDIFAYCSAEAGWSEFQDEFTIINQGGLVNCTAINNATKVVGGDVFEMYASYQGSIECNQTWRKLQHFHTEFALFFSEDSTGEDQYMQTYDNAGGPPPTEKYGGVGNFTLEVGILAADPDYNDTWVRVLFFQLYLLVGDEGANDEWTTHAIDWGDQSGLVLLDSVESFIEEEPRAQTRFWVDLWFPKDNSSTTVAGRVGSYYYGMDDSGYLFWASWRPRYINEVQSLFKSNLYDVNGTLISLRAFELFRVYMNLTRLDNPSGQVNYRVTVEDFNLFENELAGNNPLTGIDTPIFVDAKVPDMPQGGLLAPIYTAITSIGSFITNALSELARLAWDAIGNQFPWFTDFIDTLWALVTAFTQNITTIGGALVELLNFMADQFWIFGTLVDMIRDTWLLLETWLAPFADNAGDWILLFVILIGVIPFADAISRGDMKVVEQDIRRAWGIINTILTWGFNLARSVISWILEAIPF